MNPSISDNDDELTSDSVEMMEIDDLEDQLIITDTNDNNPHLNINTNNESENNESVNEHDDENTDESENDDINENIYFNLEHFFLNSLITSNASLNNINPITPFNIFELSNYQNIENHYNNYVINIIHDDDDDGEWLCNECGNNVNVIHKCCDTIYQWECIDCEHLNDMNIIRCSNCDVLRKWTCDNCNYENNINTVICLNCMMRNNDLFKWTCNICNETKEYTSRFVCSECNEPRECKCINCINNNLHIPYNFDTDDEIDFTEFEDIEKNIGLTEDELKEIKQIKWTPQCKYDMCTICINKFTDTTDNIYELDCEHKHCFHINCLNNWLSKQNTCPNCRHKLTDN